ncbi:TetR/AcrR family transcriptional regulator [Streptosporangium amethystogenes]|uniref:TetR/AcrR family transcriptional regulator n=1 Tax=Streptosporangium amethystogenes TaxID=2002 RepID=UPI0004C637B9|nr:TetR/AcrR family transcriptional regulator [Streptosporangium amethystogenes]
MNSPRRKPSDRIIDAAITRVRERGITVGLDGISLEEAIAASGVARATAYRHWPSRAGFLREVLVRVVRDTRLEPEGTEEIDALRGFISAHRDGAATEAGRRTLVVEGLRIAVEADFQRFATSREWRDYLALRATCSSLPDSDLRTVVTAELAAAEHSFVAQRAAVYSRLPKLLGYRLTTPLADDAGFELMSQAMGALLMGFVVRASVNEESPSFQARAFGSSLESRWTSTTYALVAAMLSYLEPDPSVHWTATRIAASIALLDELATLVEKGHAIRTATGGAVGGPAPDLA